MLKLAEEGQWLEFLEEAQKSTKNLQSLIAKTDTEIDAMVYELYNLTPKEIEIIESVN